MEMKSVVVDTPNVSIRTDRIESPQLGVASGAPASDKKGLGFGEMLENLIRETNTHQIQADQAIRELISGRTKNIHETLLTVEKADTSLKLMMQVRNKVLEAYREIMRMQV